MRIEFEIGRSKAAFTRSWITGTAMLEVDGVKVTLADPLELGTHFRFALTRSWTKTIHGKQLVIEKRRPRFFAGFRPQAYRVLIDSELVAEKTGY